MCDESAGHTRGETVRAESRQTLLRRSGLNSMYDVYLDRRLREGRTKVCRDYPVHRSVQFYIVKF